MFTYQIIIMSTARSHTEITKTKSECYFFLTVLAFIRLPINYSNLFCAYIVICTSNVVYRPSNGYNQVFCKLIPIDKLHEVAINPVARRRRCCRRKPELLFSFFSGTTLDLVMWYWASMTRSYGVRWTSHDYPQMTASA